MKILAFCPVSGRDGINPGIMLSLPDSAVIRNGNPFFVPDFDTAFSARLYLAVKVSRLGKTIAERFAHRYYEDAAPAFSITADNLLKDLQAQGMPWTAATAFDKSCPVGEFIPLTHLMNGNLKLEIDGKVVSEIPFPSLTEINSAITSASANNTLKMGDLILVPFRGMDKLPLSPDTNIRLLLDEDPLLELPVR